MAGGLSRGEVRLFPFPPPDKQRPVLLLTRTSAMDFLSRVTVAPITSTARGSPSEVVLGIEDGLEGTCAVNLDQTVTVPKHVGRWVASLRPDRMRDVCMALEFALGCEE